MSRHHHLEEKKMEDDPPLLTTTVREEQQRADLELFRSLLQRHPDAMERIVFSPFVDDDSNKKNKNNSDSGSIRNDAEVKEKEPKLHHSKKRSYSVLLLLLASSRMLLVDLPLALLFASYLTIYCVRILHQDYYVPLFNRAQRTDQDLLEEYTYYERQCNAYDITTQNLQDLLVTPATGTATATSYNNSNNNNNNYNNATAIMMTHGALVIPNVLDAATVRALRQHVVDRNAAVSEQEAFPVSQGVEGLRVSYGIDATEADAVTQAIQQIAHHELLQPLLQALTGDADPASAEITAITSYAGADDQVWHADTKGDGNALKFARTYTHSYSLFVSLQDTTQAMGATDICPGTQYCMNDLEAICERNKLGLHQVHPERQVFAAGDAALLNQHVWHRGSAHTDPTAPERVVFILSFLARPPARSNADQRQLSRGTYFHQRWNMWGHTWKDLLDPQKTMGYPFSVLRAMGLWKPPKYNWGYDFVTSAFLRFSNEQLEEDELYGRFLTRLDELKFPMFLRGRVPMKTSQKKSWEFFLRETIEKTFAFVGTVNGWVHAAYALVLVLISLFTRQGRAFSNSTKRLIMTHGFLLFVAFKVLSGVRKSQWGQDVLSGRRLMRPFPPVQLARADEPTGLTTLPSRLDVLVGTRYDAPFLGSYDQWLDYHPGNVALRQAVSAQAAAYSKTWPAVAERIEQDAFHRVADQNGRFLLQDYRNGDWRIMNDADAMEVVREYLIVSGNTVISSIRKSVDHMIAEYRYGLLRDTLMARLSVENLQMLRTSLFRRCRQQNTVAEKRDGLSTASYRFRLRVASNWTMSPPPLAISTQPSTTRDFSLPQPKRPTFQVGSLVWCVYGGRNWFPGSITATRSNGFYDIAFDDGKSEKNVSQLRLRQYRTVTEGDRVQGCFDEGLESCYPGTVGRVHPSGSVMIAFDDGDVEWDMTPDRYYIPPFKYAVESYY